MINFGGAKVRFFFKAVQMLEYFFSNRQMLTKIASSSLWRKLFSTSVSAVFCAFFEKNSFSDSGVKAFPWKN